MNVWGGLVVLYGGLWILMCYIRENLCGNLFFIVFLIMLYCSSIWFLGVMWDICFDKGVVVRNWEVECWSCWGLNILWGIY